MSTPTSVTFSSEMPAPNGASIGVARQSAFDLAWSGGTTGLAVIRVSTAVTDANQVIAGDHAVLVSATVVGKRTNGDWAAGPILLQ